MHSYRRTMPLDALSSRFTFITFFMFPHVCLQRRVCLQCLCGIICQLVDASDHRESCCFLACVFKRLAVFCSKNMSTSFGAHGANPSCDSFSLSSAKGSWLKPILERITWQHKGAPGSTKEHLDLQQKCVDRGSTHGSTSEIGKIGKI